MWFRVFDAALNKHKAFRHVLSKIDDLLEEGENGVADYLTKIPLFVTMFP